MEIIEKINYLIALSFMICYSYQILYIFLHLVKKYKVSEAKEYKKYALIVCARNEEDVIGQLIDSINDLNYPKEYYDTFVVADNCTDNTAAICRNKGAIVYERFNNVYIGKGYALNFLLDKIKDYEYDAYVLFDADNLLDKNYLLEMNKVYCQGYDVVNGYRNSKNYGSNWISAGYALWFLREAKFLNESRMMLKTNCAVGGTGFLFSKKLVADGWNYFTLTEDVEFSVDCAIQGYKIGYAKNAKFYDEQPTTFKQSYTQRLRWAKGFLQVFNKYGFKLAKGIIVRQSMSCYDMLMCIAPALFLTLISGFLNTFVFVYGIYTHDNISILLSSIFESLFNSYLLLFGVGLLTTISEWKEIRCSNLKKILYTFTFPLFMFTYIPISFVALFKKVEWKPIKHSHGITIKDLQNN